MSDLDLWFPYKGSRGKSDPLLRVICFHNAGGNEQIYTNKGTPKNPSPLPLLDFVLENDCEILACQLPGRGARWKENKVPSIQEGVSKIYSILSANKKISPSIPYVLVAHSMGCWFVYELLLLLQEKKQPLPAQVFLSCMVHPHISPSSRPWRVSEGLSETEFKEECVAWDINKEVFTAAGMWEMYYPMLKNDFKLFDIYTPATSSPLSSPVPSGGTVEKREISGSTVDSRPPNGSAFPCPVTLFYAKEDKRIKKEMVEQWKPYFSSSEVVELEGSHAFIYHPEHKIKFFKTICGRLDSIILDLQY